MELSDTVDMGGLSEINKERFTDFVKAHPKRNLKDLVNVWNSYAIGVEQHVFYTSPFGEIPAEKWTEKPNVKKAALARYYLEHRYQDSGWCSLNEEYDTYEAAKEAAWEHASNSIIYGMVRIMSSDGSVLVTYGAGENRKIEPHWPKEFS